MLSLSPIKAKINWHQLLWLSIGFFALRLASFLIRDNSLLQALFVLTNVLTLAFLFSKNKLWAWYYLLLEFVLGGAGLFFQAFSLSLRTILILEFLIIYFSAYGGEALSKVFWRENKNNLLVFLVALLFLSFSVYWGWKNQHALFFIAQDLLPFSFFLLIFPAREFLRAQDTGKNLLNLLFIFILGSSLWSIFNLVLFHQGVALLHSPYYNWLRDFALAKVTYLDSGFWRLVFPEHLLLIPAILFLIYLYLKTKDKIILLFLSLANIILALNISRAYLLALLVGLVVLKYQTKFFTWFKVCVITLFSFILIFFAINLSVSAGKNLGLNILGLRLPGITQIASDPSANNRLQLLKPIWQNIQSSPLVGQGLGLNINFINNVGQTINTRHFDWGYLELIAKFGLIASIFYLFIWLNLIKNLFKQSTPQSGVSLQSKKQALNLACIASLIALMISNIWAQNMLHVFGIILFSLILAFSQNQKTESH